jgi:1,4-dihydroxy-6-naphthoate synthase
MQIRTAWPVTETDAMAIRELTLGHSPDADDAFMFYALAADKIATGPWRFRHVLQDIQTLNDRATRAELDITAISIHAYPYVKDRYILTHCGASIGDGYGPVVVARTPAANPRAPLIPGDLRDRCIAVPGERTTAFLVLNLMLGVGAFDYGIIPFDQILDAVKAGRFDAGLVIHEGQLTYEQHGLNVVADLGKWWKDETGLPLPLGANVIRRDLGDGAVRDVTDILKRSIQYGLDHRDEAVAHSLKYARDMGTELADRFVGMYVNEFTLDYGQQGRDAVQELLRRGHAAGIVPDPGNIDFV